MIDARELFQSSSSKLDKYILSSLTISCIKLDYDTSHARYKVYVYAGKGLQNFALCG